MTAPNQTSQPASVTLAQEFGFNEHISIGDLPAEDLTIRGVCRNPSQQPKRGDEIIPVIAKLVANRNMVKPGSRMLTKMRPLVANELTRTNQTYITIYEDKFHQMSTLVVPAGEHLLKFVTRPPILREGFVCYNKALYFVTIDDIRRGIIRKSRMLAVAPRRLTTENFINGTSASQSFINTIARLTSGSGNAETGDPGTGPAEGSEAGAERPGDGGAGRTAGQRPEDPGSSNFVDDTGSDESKLVDTAFQEQIVALLNSENSQEWTWEVEEG